MVETPDNPLDWSEPGAPRSRRFGDVYYSLEDGLAESRAVFLAGCGLPDAWAGRARFTVAELGFGTGLNLAALLHLWRESGATGRLHIFSVEGFPVAREDAARALSAWPEIADAARALLDRWPPVTPGFHRIDLPDWNATFDLAIGDAGGGDEQLTDGHIGYPSEGWCGVMIPASPDNAIVSPPVKGNSHGFVIAAKLLPIRLLHPRRPGPLPVQRTRAGPSTARRRGRSPQKSAPHCRAGAPPARTG